MILICRHKGTGHLSLAVEVTEDSLTKSNTIKDFLGYSFVGWVENTYRRCGVAYVDQTIADPKPQIAEDGYLLVSASGCVHRLNEADFNLLYNIEGKHTWPSQK